MIYPNDHRPAHVIGNECEAVFKLNCPDGLIELRGNYGAARRQLASFARELTENLSRLCRGWEKIHGVA